MDNAPMELCKMRELVIRAVTRCTDETLLDLVWKLLVLK